MISESANLILKPLAIDLVVNGGKRLAAVQGNKVVSRLGAGGVDSAPPQHGQPDPYAGGPSSALITSGPDVNLAARQLSAKFKVFGLTFEVPLVRPPSYRAPVHIQPMPTLRDLERLDQKRLIMALVQQEFSLRSLQHDPASDILVDPAAVRIDLDQGPQTQVATKQALTKIVQSFDMAQTLATVAKPFGVVPHRAYLKGSQAIGEAMAHLTTSQQAKVLQHLQAVDPETTSSVMTKAIDAATQHIRQPSDMKIIEAFLLAYHTKNVGETTAILKGLRQSGNKGLADQLDMMRLIGHISNSTELNLALGVAAYRACQLLNLPTAGSYEKGLAIAELTLLAAGSQATKPDTQMACFKAAAAVHASVSEALGIERPKPNGKSVTAVLDLRMSFGKTARGARLALDAMAQVHGLGDLSALKYANVPIWRLGPIDAWQNQGTRGWIVCHPQKPWIQLNPFMASAFPESTLPHECGHLWDLSLDHSVPMGQMASHTSSALISPVMHSLFNTPEVTKLQAMQKHYESLAKNAQSPAQQQNYANRAAYFEYLTTPTEVFARYYAQYIGHESDNAVILGQIDEDRNPNTIDKGLRQWSDSSFMKVRPELIELFKKQGFLT